MTATLLVLAITIALVVAALCAGAETGFLSVSRDRVLHMARQGGKRAKIVQQALANMGRTTTVLLVGNNLASVSFSSASAALSARAFPESALAQAVWGVCAALAMLYLGEFLPKLFFAARPLRRSLWIAHVWKVFARLFAPLGEVVMFIIRHLLPRRETRTQMTPEAVLRILEDRKDGVKLTDFESALIARIMVLRSKGRSVTPEALLSVIDSELD